MDKLTLDVLAAGLSLFPLLLLYRCIDPKAPSWVSLPAGLASAALAGVFFWLWQRLEHPVIAYIDAATYGSLALCATLQWWTRRPGASDARPVPGSQAASGVEPRPGEPNGLGTGSP